MHDLDLNWELPCLRDIHLHYIFDAAILLSCLKNAPALKTIVFESTCWQDPTQSTETTNLMLRKVDGHLVSTSAFPSLSQIDVLCSKSSDVTGRESQLLWPLFSNIRRRLPGKINLQFLTE